VVSGPPGKPETWEGNGAKHGVAERLLAIFIKQGGRRGGELAVEGRNV